jgi:hypothetical protein
MNRHKNFGLDRVFPVAIIALLAVVLVAVIPPDRAVASGAAGAPGVIPQDTRIVVNIPAFRMDLFDNGKLVKSYKIGIGYPEFPLPTGLRSADTIIISPTWTPPNEPWVESPTSKVKAGEKIAAGDKLNPLGPIKIPIGLPSLIHGGKAPGSIGGFASHGCVGLTNREVEDFAARLAQISGTNISAQQIAQDEKNKTETQPVKLSKAVAVELRYETITVEGGKLHIYRDVYARGTDTEQNLRDVLQVYGVTEEMLSKTERAQVMTALTQMERDAVGKPVAKPAGDASQPKKSTTRHVTRTISGQKEVAVQVAALKGKGYPAPVDLDSGGASKSGSSHARRRR